MASTKRPQTMTGNFSSEVEFWRALGAALKDPEFREAFVKQLREMIENGNDEV